jgi:hypothetical protein
MQIPTISQQQDIRAGDGTGRTRNVKFLTWVCCTVLVDILIRVYVMAISRKQWELEVIKQIMFLQENKVSSDSTIHVQFLFISRGLLLVKM